MLNRIFSVTAISLGLLTSVACQNNGSSEDSEERHSQSQSDNDVATVAFITGLRGTTEPCGCTSAPLGGLDRVAAEVERLRAEGNFSLFVVGDTFFEEINPAPHRITQEKSKADAIAQVLQRLKPSGIVTGGVETGPMAQEVERLAKKYELPIFSGPRSLEKKDRADSLIQTLAGLRLGFVGISGEPFSELSAYIAGSVAMHPQNTDFIVGLFPVGGDAGRAFTERVEGLNLVVGGGSEHGLDPHIAGRALFCEASEKGQYIGLLRLHPNGAKGEELKWVYNDQGRVEKAGLQLRIERFIKAAARMGDGAAKTARLAKVTELEDKRDAVKTDAPQGPYVTWEVQKITTKHARAGWATEILADYNRSICGITKAATAELECKPASSSEDRYVGNEKCASCHVPAMKAWKETKHARAWKTLTDAGKECDLGCIGCHSVGYDKSGGYCRVQDAPKSGDVGCETCHGPGAGHSLNPKVKNGAFIAKPQSEDCESCHTPEHSDLFDFETYNGKIIVPGHGLPLAD